MPQIIKEMQKTFCNQIAKIPFSRTDKIKKEEKEKEEKEEKENTEEKDEIENATIQRCELIAQGEFFKHELEKSNEKMLQFREMNNKLISSYKKTIENQQQELKRKEEEKIRYEEEVVNLQNEVKRKNDAIKDLQEIHKKIEEQMKEQFLEIEKLSLALIEKTTEAIDTKQNVTRLEEIKQSKKKITMIQKKILQNTEQEKFHRLTSGLPCRDYNSLKQPLKNPIKKTVQPKQQVKPILKKVEKK